jgi:hypothetical protein
VVGLQDLATLRDLFRASLVQSESIPLTKIAALFSNLDDVILTNEELFERLAKRPVKGVVEVPRPGPPFSFYAGARIASPCMNSVGNPARMPGRVQLPSVSRGNTDSTGLHVGRGEAEGDPGTSLISRGCLPCDNSHITSGVRCRHLHRCIFQRSLRFVLGLLREPATRVRVVWRLAQRVA